MVIRIILVCCGKLGRNKVLLPGFEPGSSGREPEMLDRTTLQQRTSPRRI